MLGWPHHKDGRRMHAQSSLLQRAQRRKVRLWCSKKALKMSAEETACTCMRESAISHGSRKPQTETAGAHQWKQSVVNLRQRGIKLQRKTARGRKRQQHPYHPNSKPSSVQSALWGAHKESVSTTNEHARIDNQPSQQSLSVRNEPS